MKRDSMVFYRSFYEAVKGLSSAERLSCIETIIRYGLDGTEPEDGGVAAMVLQLVRPVIDHNNERYLNGRKGGRPKTKTEPKQNLDETKTEPRPNQDRTKTEPYVYEYVDAYEDANVDKDIKKAPAARFIKPTLEEVSEYCRQRKNNVDPGAFIDFYNSNGWKVGRNPMKDWKAAVRTWEKRAGSAKKPNGFDYSDQREYNYQELEKKLLRRG